MGAIEEDMFYKGPYCATLRYRHRPYAVKAKYLEKSRAESTCQPFFPRPIVPDFLRKTIMAIAFRPLRHWRVRRSRIHTVFKTDVTIFDWEIHIYALNYEPPATMAIPQNVRALNIGLTADEERMLIALRQKRGAMKR
jgi:hypothetical protein